MLGGQHYGMGGAFDMPAGQEFHKLYGPFLIYANKTSATSNAAGVLWQDALAQAKAEQGAWPYEWFKESTYLQAAQRGTVSGAISIDDWGTPGASSADLWVGLAPAGTDFQQQTKTCQFWTKSDATGSFEIKNVVPGRYTLYAFGRGANGQFAQPGVVVKAGQNPSIHPVWVPDRKGTTAWEIGYPDRTAEKFKHDTDYFRWGVFQQFPADFPKGLTYTVGKSDWRKDWNFAQPTLADTDATGATVYHQYPWTIDFDLAAAPLSGANDSASLYFSFASTFSAALIVSVNGTNVTTPTTGFFPANPSDAMIRLGSHGAWSEARSTFPAKLLKAGANTILLNQRKAASGASVMYDYLRLELPGKVVGVANRSHLSSLARRGDRIWGDGIHAVELVGLDGHRVAWADPGAALSLRGTSRGTYLARCAGETTSLVVP
jgi:rhamnogalacturonan endolyase